jgi:hypothetical protein
MKAQTNPPTTTKHTTKNPHAPNDQHPSPLFF